MRLGRIALAASGTLAAFLVLGEAAVRIRPPKLLGRVSTHEQGGQHFIHPEQGIYMLDDELGFRPVPGGEWYAPHGAKWNDYVLERPPDGETGGPRRLLFLGDSATQRGRLVEGLRAVFGEEDYEYWNAGVEAYYTGQEVEYYRRFLDPIDEDHVILTFHLNDFTVTPIVFMHEGRMVLVRVGDPRVDVRRGLYERSHLYRLLVALSMRSRRDEGLTEDLEQQIAGILSELIQLTRERGSRLTVLVLPWLEPPSTWRDVFRKKHARILEILARLEIEHYDLLPVFSAALDEGVPLPELAEDPAHPGLELGLRAAAEMKRLGFVP